MRHTRYLLFNFIRINGPSLTVTTLNIDLSTTAFNFLAIASTYIILARGKYVEQLKSENEFLYVCIVLRTIRVKRFYVRKTRVFSSSF